MTRRQLGGLSLAFLWLLLFLAAPLNLPVGSFDPNVAKLKVSDPMETPNREDCEAILGTVFRSRQERDWFHQNCGQWPQALEAAPLASGTDREALLSDDGVLEACGKQRGRPYADSAARTWYLENCNESNPEEGSEGSSGPIADATAGQDRTSCDEIRGTTYRSRAEQEWFLERCSGNSNTANNTGLATGQDTEQSPMPAQVPQESTQQQAPQQQPDAPTTQPEGPYSSACGVIAANGGPATVAQREFYLRYCP